MNKETVTIKLLGIEPDTTFVVFERADKNNTYSYQRDHKKIDADIVVEKDKEIDIILHHLEYHPLVLDEMVFNGDATVMIRQRKDPAYINESNSTLMKLFEKKKLQIVREKMINTIMGVEDEYIDNWIEKYETGRYDLFLEEKPILMDLLKKEIKRIS